MRRRARFTREQRLLRPKQFERVFADACKSSDGLLVVLGRANTIGMARLGLAMSAKHLKTSPARNRVKRIVRGNFRQQAHELGGVDFVVMARAGAMSASNTDLHRAAQRHLLNVARKIRGE
ncbi:MAG: ribonuclease P protein component [Gammaproteobacteria bacterium]